MEKNCGIILPNQLFKPNPLFQKTRNIFLIEHPRYFYDFNFHKKKLLLHAASMRAYEQYLSTMKIKLEYIEAAQASRKNFLNQKLKAGKFKQIHIIDPVDHKVLGEMEYLADHLGADLVVHDTPMFLSSPGWLKSELGQSRHYIMNNFYISQRKRLGILLKGDQPAGGKWSFDKENRKKLPRSIQVPAIEFPSENKFVDAAKTYIESDFKNNPGSVEEFIFPVTHSQARDWFEQFLNDRLRLFGPYEDAIVKDQQFLFHSLLSPMLNTGLLEPAYVVNTTLDFAAKNKIPLNSLEGFIRQIIGWREFIRAIYIMRGKEQSKSNFWQCSNKIDKKFYYAQTGIEPVDSVISHLVQKAWVHHIERLMILGNFFLLCETAPGEVYCWFMELFIDSYDWVMVPNLFGMSQFADGGIMATKPYISSSNYIRKMSDFKRQPWCDTWDALYWSFINKHKAYFLHNARLRVTTSHLDRMGRARIAAMDKTARRFKDKLFS